MKNKLVSVIIPVYNVELYVEKAIVSIINQTYKNLEVIVVDDCSKDDTYKIVKELQKKDSRIRLYKNEINSQIVTSLNKAFFNSSGEYIIRMDGDDISMPDRIEIMVDFLENNDYDLLGSSITAIDTNDNIIGYTKHYANQEILNKTLKYTIPMSHIWIAKRKVYETLNGYREISGAEDDDFVFRATSLGFKYTNLENYYGYHVRLGRDGNSNSLLGLKKLKMRNYTYKLFLEQLKNSGKDSFSDENLIKYIKSNIFIEKLHYYSNNFLYKAIEFKGKQQYVKVGLYLLLSCISPYQIKYLYERIIYKIIVITIRRKK